MNTLKQYILKHKGAILALFVFMAIAFYTGRITNRQTANFILHDSIQVIQNRNNEYYSRVNSYVVSERELKAVNSKLFEEVKKLREKPLTIESIQTTTKFSGKLKTIASADSTILTWSADTIFSAGNNFKIEGTSNFKTLETVLKNLKIDSKLYISQTEKNDKIYLNARSDNPALTFTELEGYIVNPLSAKKKRIGIGVFVGVSPELKPIVGIGVSYNLITF